MIIRSTPGRSVISIRWCDRSFLRVWRLCARREPSIVAGEVRRCQDHLAEPSVRHLADWPRCTTASTSSRTRSMGWSPPAKTGLWTRVSTRPVMVDSRCMPIPLVMSHDDELSLAEPRTTLVETARGEGVLRTGQGRVRRDPVESIARPQMTRPPPVDSIHAVGALPPGPIGGLRSRPARPPRAKSPEMTWTGPRWVPPR
jgi:hypothetical protein